MLYLADKCIYPHYHFVEDFYSYCGEKLHVKQCRMTVIERGLGRTSKTVDG